MNLRLLALLATLLAPLTACDELTKSLDSDAGFFEPDAGDATDTPELAFDEVSAAFELDGDDFFRMPWPSDYRKTGDGHIDLSDFPNPGVPLVTRYIDAVQTELRGYSLMPIVYVALDRDPIPETVPEPWESLYPEGPVQLVDVSPSGCGTRVPVEVAVNHAVDPYIGENVLMAAPVPGFALRRDTPYALLVLETLGNPDGYGVAPAPAVVAALAGTHQDAAFDATFAPLRDCLPELGVAAETISVATVFTTQDPVSQMRALRAHVTDPDETPSPTVTSFEYSDEHSLAGYETYIGEYETPIYQDGVSPYAATGGAIHFDEAGQPVVQRWESVPFAVSFPRGGTPPYDLLIWVDGTGATETSWVGSSVTEAMREAGFAVASYAAQFHGSRATPGSNDELHSFNFPNPQAFRNTFRQQVADTSYFVRVMTEARNQMEGLAEIDDSVIVYGGQSQGSMIGTMVAAVEPRIDAFMLNGVAAYLSLTAVERTDPIDFAALIAEVGRANDDFDRMHPLMAVVQTGADASDPHSFAGDWVGWEGDPDGVDILLVNGIDDTTAPVPAMNAIVIAGGVAPVDPPGWDIDPFGVWNRFPEPTPIAGNRDPYSGRARTQAALLSNTTGHFTIYGRADVRETAIRFLRSAADGSAIIE